MTAITHSPSVPIAGTEPTVTVRRRTVPFRRVVIQRTCVARRDREIDKRASGPVVELNAACRWGERLRPRLTPRRAAATRRR